MEFVYGMLAAIAAVIAVEIVFGKGLGEFLKEQVLGIERRAIADARAIEDKAKQIRKVL